MERALLWIVAAQLVVLPWALGGMELGGQLLALGLGALALGTALLPRDYDEETAREADPFRLYTWPKLMAFPPFWLGLAFLILVLIQALNPSWKFLTDGKSWWMQAVPHLAWLPTGVAAPILRGGPWRILIVDAAALMTVCAAWIGFIRRKSYQILFTVLAGNAFALACLGLAERAFGAKKIFWLWKPPDAYFVASFIYKNHAGAYFNLLFALCAGLAMWHYRRSQRRNDKSSPSGLFALFALVIALVVGFSYSRTATLLLIGCSLLFLGVMMRLYFSTPSARRENPAVAAVLAGVLFIFLIVGVRSIGISTFIDRMTQLRQQLQDATPGMRTLAHRATWEMARAKLIDGWGAGSFRFLFPVYQRRYPPICVDETGSRLYWEHAHNDYLEGLAEVGAIGALLVAGAICAALLLMARAKAWKNPLSLCVLIGTGLTLAHSTVDFNFYNPAILITWWVLVFAAIRWAELEDSSLPAVR